MCTCSFNKEEEDIVASATATSIMKVRMNADVSQTESDTMMAALIDDDARFQATWCQNLMSVLGLTCGRWHSPVTQFVHINADT